MKLAIVASNWPFPQHSVRAANVVVFELVRALAMQPGLQVAFLKVGHVDESDPGEEEKAGIEALRCAGVHVLQPLKLAKVLSSSNRLSKLLAPRVVHFYPDEFHGPAIAAVLSSWGADALLVPWSEWLTAACSTVPLLKFAYYGNPDHKTAMYRAQHDRQLGGSLWAYARMRLALRRLEQMHIEVMRRYHLVGDVAANDADYYSKLGHPNAFYIRNIWIDRLGEAWRVRRAALERSAPLAIVANVGKLDGTANRYGLDYLGREVLPALAQRLAPGSFRLEILGAGNLHPQVAKHLAAPEIVFRGFVPDIDEAILTAPIFLCVNNATPFKVGHTRYLHAWTLGACVVAHRDAALSMPEIVDGQNALLGSDAAGIADAIVCAIGDSGLRRRIGEGGWNSYLNQFRAQHVAAEIVRRLRAKYDCALKVEVA